MTTEEKRKQLIHDKLKYYSNPFIYFRKIEELKDSEEKVAWILQKYPRARNHDKLLIFYFWKEIDNFQGEMDEEAIMQLTNTETIRRNRQFLQNVLHLFEPDEDIKEQREICQEAVRDYINNKTEGIK